MKQPHRILAAGLTLLATPALANDSGMPQLDPTWYPSQLFWLAVSFVVLYAIVSLFITPRVGGVLKARADAINEAIALAEKLKKQADNTKGNFEQISAEARAEASQIIAAAQAEAAKEAAAANAKLDEQIAAKIAAAEADIRQATSRATANLEAAAMPLAKEMAEKLLGSDVEETAVRTAIGAISKAA